MALTRTLYKVVPVALRSDTSQREMFHPLLNHDFLHHFAGNICQPKVAPGVAVSQLLVVETQEMKNRGVEIVNVHRVFLHLHSEFIALAINCSALDAAACEERRERRVRSEERRVG